MNKLKRHTYVGYIIQSWPHNEKGRIVKDIIETTEKIIPIVVQGIRSCFEILTIFIRTWKTLKMLKH